jgi:hypothetical protein
MYEMVVVQPVLQIHLMYIQESCPREKDEQKQWLVKKRHAGGEGAVSPHGDNKKDGLGEATVF